MSASPNARDLDDHSPLLTAVLRKTVPLARLLIKHKSLVTHKEVKTQIQSWVCVFVETLLFS
jgi:ankyrin repeat protein